MNWLMNGEVNATLSPLDRGLAYGDGVFRTLKVLRGEPVWWADHYVRLAQDCAALKLVCPDADLLRNEIHAVTATCKDAVVKIILTRGPGARGYAVPDSVAPTRIVIATPLPNELDIQTGIRARWCTLKLARQPQLAGIKHLNRLENVLARQEWSSPDIIEGLLCDDTGAVIGGTRSNLFAIAEGRLYTPDLTHSGVAGVTRTRILRAAQLHGIKVQVGRLECPDILNADEVFLSNSIAGLWRIARLDTMQWHSATWSKRFLQWMNEAD
ncbi:MAG: aminodeoxychorismate lyase [Thiobacillus sp.]